jgi:serine/threonine protein kinase
MKYYSNGNLQQYLNTNGCFPESKAIDLLKDLINAFAYLKEKKVELRDMKPDNIFIDENWRLVLGDFGSSEVEVETHIKRQASNYLSDPPPCDRGVFWNSEYAAPELNLSLSSTSPSTQQVDRR